MSKQEPRGTKKSTPKSPVKKPKQPTAIEKELQDKNEKLEMEVRILRSKLDPKTIEDELRKANKVTEESLENLLQQQIRYLECILGKYEARIGISRDQISKTEDVTEFNQKIVTLKKENDTKDAQINEKDTMINDLKKQLTEAQSSKEKDTVANREKERILENQKDDFKRKLDQANSELLLYKNRLPKVLAESASTKAADPTQLEDLKTKVKSLNEQLSNTQNKLKFKDDEMKNRHEEVEQLKRDLDESGEKVQTLQKEINGFKSKPESTISAAKASEESLQVKLEQLQSTIEKRENTIKEQKNQIEKIQTDLNRDLNEEKDRCKELKKEIQGVQEKIEEKEGEIGRKDKLIETLQSSSDKDTKNEKVLKAKDEEISSLKKELEKLERSNEENKKKLNDQDNRMKQLEDEHKKDIKKKETDNETLKKEKEDAEKSSQDNIKKLTEQKNRIKQMEEEHKEEIKKKDATIADLKKEKTGSDKTRGTSSNTDTKGLRDRHEQTVRELSEAKSEVSELKYRLSQVVGAKVMDDNPNITDLSDENRPTKLSEKYSELYDNEWTDAYEEAENEYKTEQEVIKHLYQKLLDIFAFCQKISEEYAMKLKSCALTIPSAENGRPKSANIGVTNLRQLKELRKSFSPHLVENVFQHYMKTKKLDLKKRVKTEKFIRECVKICWLMSSQDPPVIFDTSNVTGTFDGDKFRTYTKSGKIFDFVVWPPMLLHKNGPMLCKGVAQGK